MTKSAPPLRFIAVVIGGWICVRAVFLGAEWLGRVDPVKIVRAAEPKLVQQRAKILASAVLRQDPPSIGPKAETLHPGAIVRQSFSHRSQVVGAVRLVETAAAEHRLPDPPPFTASEAAFAPPRSGPRIASRWAASAWLFGREGGKAALAPAGTLGGSQIGARLTYRLNADPARSLALSARFYSPLKDFDAAEVAVGADWQPVAFVPVRILAERREAIGRSGRSAFSLLAYGGVSQKQVVGPLELDAYAQAGVVGARSRDLFADGSARLSVPVVARVRVGAGLWGAAQPGVARLDVGPTASWRIAPRIGLLADWRFRLAGNAAPGSGPALTLSTDF